MIEDRKITRIDLIKTLAALPAAAAVLAATSTVAEAAATGSKTQFKYVDHPNGSKKCSNCSLYIANKNSKKNGTCKVVAGSISPNGYCIAWSAKHK